MGWPDLRAGAVIAPDQPFTLLGLEVMKYDTNFKSVKDEVSAEEWQARVELAACYWLVDQYEMTDLIYNHITARIPGTDHLLINLYGSCTRRSPRRARKDRRRGRIIAKPTPTRHQQIRLRDPRRDPQGATGGQMRAAHPPRRHRGVGHAMWAVAAVADLDPLRRPHRLSRL
jgi:hypothetical protein